MNTQIKHFPRKLAKYLFKNIDKGLIRWNIESESHFFSTYDTSTFYDLLDSADDVKFIMNLYSVADWDYKQTWDDLLDRRGKVKLSIFTLNSLFEDEREYFENKLGDKEYMLEYNDDGIPDIIVDKKELSPQYIGYLLDEVSDKLSWSDVQFIPKLPPKVKESWEEVDGFSDEEWEEINNGLEELVRKLEESDL